MMEGVSVIPVGTPDIAQQILNQSVLLIGRSLGAGPDHVIAVVNLNGDADGGNHSLGGLLRRLNSGLRLIDDIDAINAFREGLIRSDRSRLVILLIGSLHEVSRNFVLAGGSHHTRNRGAVCHILSVKGSHFAGTVRSAFLDNNPNGSGRGSAGHHGNRGNQQHSYQHQTQQLFTYRFHVSFLLMKSFTFFRNERRVPQPRQVSWDCCGCAFLSASLSYPDYSAYGKISQ